ncbi:MAG: YkgJ family cysteine cluster protein [Nitrososphaerota archaeon]
MADFSNLCASCKTQGCCTNSAVPLVFSSDLADLKSINKAGDEFLHDRNVNGFIIKAINKKANSDVCVFWNENKCSIYRHRPFDCRAYPFDILKINCKYHWIVYSCNPKSDWTWTEDHLQTLEKDKAFPEVMKKIEIFSGNTGLILPVESKKTPYTILRQVKY